MSELEQMIDKQQKLSNRAAINGKEDEAEITKALTFLVDGKAYGVEIPYIKEILGVPHITVIPGVPHYIMGIINVRSKVVPVVNARSRFDIEPIEFDEKTCTIITEYKDISVGLIVDAVLDVLPVSKKNMANIPALEQVNNNKFIQYILEIGDEVKMILDIKKLIFDNEFVDSGEEE